MSKIKIEDIKQEAESIGWTLLSDQYKNLDADLLFQCKNGHKVCTSLKKFRMRPSCPTCDKSFVTKNLSNGVPRKPAGIKRIMALDDATGTTGYSILDGKDLVHYGKVTMTEATSIQRIASVRQWLLSMIENWKPDIIALEDIQLQQGRFENVKIFKVLAQLQGTLLVTILESGAHAEVVPPVTWRSSCGFKTKTRQDQKRQAQKKVQEWFDIEVTQDEADAICIGYHLAKKYYDGGSLSVWGEDL